MVVTSSNFIFPPYSHIHWYKIEAYILLLIYFWIIFIIWTFNAKVSCCIFYCCKSFYNFNNFNTQRLSKRHNYTLTLTLFNSFNTKKSYFWKCWNFQETKFIENIFITWTFCAKISCYILYSCKSFYIFNNLDIQKLSKRQFYALTLTLLNNFNTIIPYFWKCWDFQRNIS